MWVVALGEDGNAYVVDGIRARMNLTERTDTLFELHRKWKPMQTRYEEYGMQADIEHIKSEMEHRQYRFKIWEVGGGVQKEARIRRLIPWFEGGKIWFPKDMHREVAPGVVKDIVKQFIEEEYATFPVGKYDDAFDCLARLAEPKPSLPWPKEGEKDRDTNPIWSVLDEITGY
jgi:predicted phage terminase large subunit-like protein